MLSARDADPGAPQKEKKSVLADYIVSDSKPYYLTITLRLPYACSITYPECEVNLCNGG